MHAGTRAAIKLLALSATLTGGAVYAQGEIEGQVQDSLRPPAELERPTPSSVVEPPRARPQAPPSDKTLEIRRFVFGGNSIFSSGQLENLVRDFTGRPITLLELYDAADRVAEHYVRSGFTLASVAVPAQRVSDGIVRLEVIEGRYGEIKVEGNDMYEADHIRRYLGSIPFGRHYKAGELDEGLRQLNKLPGLTAKAVLRPGTTYGTSDVILKVTERRISGSFVVDNYGRENIGEMRWAASINVNNPSGSEDQLQFLGLRSEDGRLTYGYLAYSLPVNTTGTRAVLSYGQADFQVPENNLSGENENARLQVNIPVIQTDVETLRVMPAVSRTSSSVDLLGNPTALGTSITLVELGAFYNRTYDNLAVSQVNAEISSDFDRVRDVNDRNAQRFKLELDAQHLHPIDSRRNLLGFARFHGVYSPDALPDTERFSLGGPTSVRGYPASETRGDRGVFGTLGLRQPFQWADARMQGRIFIDSGRVWLVDQPAGAADQDSLTSVGIGLDAALPGNMNLKFDWAFPRDGDADQRQVSDDRKHGRLFGSLTVGF